MREDKPLEAPSLIELSAHVVACGDNLYKYSQFAIPSASNISQSFSNFPSAESSECTSPSSTCSSSPNNSEHSFSGIPPKIYRARHIYRHKSPPNEDDIELQTVELPIAASELVLKYVCENLRQTEDENNSIKIIPAATTERVSQALRPFMNGFKCPIGNMNLSGLNISDKTLGKLLNAQKRTLTRLDLSGIQV